jgi:CxxC motif-containing protein
MNVEDIDGRISVDGNKCPNGAEYAVVEMTAPKRVITSLVKIGHGVVPVKTNGGIDKNKIFDALAVLKGLVLTAPIITGDVIVKNVLGSGVDFVATGSFPE